MTVRLIRVVLVLAALPVGWYGLSLLWDMTGADKISIVVWLVGGLVAHDAVFAPACIAAGYGVRRILPQQWWPPVLAAASATLIMVVLSLPVLLPRSAALEAPGGNEAGTLLDRPYALSLAIAVVVIWVLTAVIVVARRRRSRAEDLAPGDGRELVR
ncbi:hypothetical protein ACXVUM_09920 [Williamsia sp. SKLECPSW1]